MKFRESAMRKKKWKCNYGRKKHLGNLLEQVWANLARLSEFPLNNLQLFVFELRSLGLHRMLRHSADPTEFE
jgi:hypothetical protein